jgi:hypothetical protein
MLCGDPSHRLDDLDDLDDRRTSECLDSGLTWKKMKVGALETDRQTDRQTCPVLAELTPGLIHGDGHTPSGYKLSVQKRPRASWGVVCREDDPAISAHTLLYPGYKYEY